MGILISCCSLMCPAPALPMNLSINTSPARMATSAILSALPARFFLLNRVRSQSLFNQRSCMEKMELGGKTEKQKKKKRIPQVIGREEI